MPRPSAAILTGFVLENLPAATLARQVEVYRALADLSGTRDERARYEAEAQHCERLIAEHDLHQDRHEQLVLDFRRRAGGPRI